jgi:peptidoglycan/LPS O-acetylase OafA/YrhL
MSSPKNQTRSNYIPSIDGLRTLAVAAVLLYHLGVKWIPGGFLGVDLFFVISGYVITRLILDSIEGINGLDLKEFYWARARRLFPGLLAVVIVSIIISAIFAPDAIHRLLSDAPFVLTGTNNWHLVALHQDYFAANGRPPLLQHTWSLAVEAQFYAIWPLILYFIWRKYGRKNVAKAALLIALSSGLALFLFSIRVDNNSSSKVSHIYFGTDTHSLGLFLGSALAVSWIPRNLTANISQRAQDFIDGIGLVGLFGLLCTFLFINESNATLYRLAFPLAGIFGCATIISLVHPASRFAPILSSKPMIWIGERSYGIYLWHWVIFQITRPSIDLAAASASALNAARILLVLACADISLRYLEIPIRRQVIQNWVRGIKYRTKRTQKHQKIFLATCITLISLLTVSSASAAWYRNNHAAKIIKKDTPLSEVTISAANNGIWLTGDSIILGVKTRLAQKKSLSLVNARVGRQIGELIDVVKADAPQVPNSVIVLDVGNNNALVKADLVTLMELIKHQPKIILVNTAVPRAWREENDRLIQEVAANYPQVKLIDWNSISNNHPEFFAPDGVHLNENGNNVYAAAILEALG